MAVRRLPPRIAHVFSVRSRPSKSRKEPWARNKIRVKAGGRGGVSGKPFDKRQQPAGLLPLAEVVCNESGATRAHRSRGEWLEGH